MDCEVPVDDLLEVYQGNELKIPKTIPSSCANADQCFFINLEVELMFPVDDDDDEFESARYVGTDTYKFWAPCLKVEHGNLAKDMITSMLTKAGIPMHKQEGMAESISWHADMIANAAHNKDVRVLPMMVKTSIIACWCFVSDDDMN
ncbi:hypothetical protein CASFOL_021568 [Castilleja foliolosa]|uniref:Uncharacterized protein n=1 Tax=Castilleja foliolosa TaxID=1961234 RepID=A0ABD3CY66_9LAMI